MVENSSSTWSQVKAMLTKNAILKKRAWRNTLLEVLSPVLLLAVLSIGYSLSLDDVYNVPAINYARTEYPLNTISRALLEALNCSNGFGSGGSLPEASAANFSSGCVASSLVGSLLNYKGAAPVPTLDQFLLASRQLQAAIRSNGSDVGDMVERLRLADSRFDNLVYGGKLSFAPASLEVEKLVDWMNSTFDLFDSVYHKTFETIEDALQDAVSTSGISDRTWALVSFQELDFENKKIEFSIHMNWTVLPTTHVLYNRFEYAFSNSFLRYFLSGFLSLQSAVGSYVLKTSASPGNSTLDERAYFTAVPFPTRRLDGVNPFYQAVGRLVGFYMTMTLLYPVSQLIKNLVEEKESKTKELMKIMGLRDSAFGLSWFLTYLILFLLISILSTILMCSTFVMYSNSVIIFLLVFLFLTSLIPFCFAVSAFFNKAKSASIVGPLILFVAVMPRYAFLRSAEAQGVVAKRIWSLLSPVAFAFGGDMVMTYEGAQLGVQWSSMWEDDLSFGFVLLILTWNCIMYSLIAWYLDQVVLGEYGSKQPWYFVFLRSYWFKDRSSYRPVSAEPEGVVNFVERRVDETKTREVLSLRNLRKEFVQGFGATRRTTVAVESLDLDFFCNEITALLGHNGAGKTTTISMLTGLITPTCGEFFFNDLCSSDMKEFRSMIGVCPQQNVIFDNLTVLEHLRLYAVLKGVKKEQVDVESVRRIHEVGLGEKKDSLAKSLSGGMKRKLCLAIATIGDSKIIFLDEPTSGMDPYARRDTWDLIRRYRLGRVIVLTTHFMDEADLLADRIAIMAEGKLKCVGSSLALKAQYGTGYNLTIVRSSDAFDHHEIKRVVERCVPETNLLSEVFGEMSFQLPFQQRGQFPLLLGELDRVQNTLGIGAYGISMTTLEEVFLKVAVFDHSQQEKQKMEKQKIAAGSPESALEITGTVNPDDVKTADLNQNVEPLGILSQTRELLYKRYLCSKRDLVGRFCEVILPVCIVAVTLWVIGMTWSPAGPRRELGLSTLREFKPRSQRPLNVVLPVSTSSFDLGTSSALEAYDFVTLERRDEFDSVTMSDYLLESIFRHGSKSRYIAMLFGDSIPLGQIDEPESLIQELIRSNDQLRQAVLQSFGSEELFDAFLDGLVSGNVSFSFEVSHLGTISIQDRLAFLLPPATLLHNTTSGHAVAAGAGALLDASYKALHNDNSASLRSFISPLPLTPQEQQALNSVLSILASLFILIPFCYLPASYTIFIVKERSAKSKHLQFVSGASPIAYWTSTYLWDIINYVFTVSFVMIVFLGFQSEEFVGTSNKAGGVTLLFILYGFAVIPLSYLYSFNFENHSTSQIAISGIHFFCGFVLVVASFIMDGVESTQKTNQILKPYYRLMPPFALGEGLFTMSQQSLLRILSGESRNVFEFDVIGRNLLYLSIECFVFSGLVLAFETPLVRSIIKTCLDPFCKAFSRSGNLDSYAGSVDSGEDDDVASERLRVEQGNPNDILLIKGLRKVYSGSAFTKPVVAVRNLSLGVGAGEVFGFLGINGAGKTTTMSILTGDQSPTLGTASVSGYDILRDTKQVRRLIGYCPQFDPLLDLMTGREHLRLFARLRGVENSIVDQVVSDLLGRIGLDMFADKVSASYSGGNKRKLSLGIALVGGPKTVYLDEPSSGMDPVSRRFMWDVISSFRANRCILLTTHSMEECEALCSRVGIMVGGALKCLGSIPHLKNKFGEGYSLDLKLSDLKGETVEARRVRQQRLKKFVDDAFPGAELQEEFPLLLKYRIPLESVKNLAAIFQVIEDSREELALEDYSLSQSSLEQIFIALAKNNTAEPKAVELTSIPIS